MFQFRDLRMVPCETQEPQQGQDWKGNGLDQACSEGTINNEGRRIELELAMCS